MERQCKMKPARIEELENQLKEKDILYIQLNEKIQELSFLNSISQEVSEKLSFDKTVKNVLNGIMDYVSPDIVLLFLKEKNQLVLVGKRYSSKNIKLEEIPVHRVGECLCGLAAKEKIPFHSVNIHNDPRCTWDECRKARLLSFIALPLVRDKKLIGIIGIGTKTKERDFSTQLEFLETIANYVSISLHNSLLYKKLKNQNTKIDQANKKLHSEMAKRKETEDELSVSLSKLAQKNNELENLIYSVSHDIKTPLVTIKGYVDILDKLCSGTCNGSKGYIERIDFAATKLFQLIHDLIEYTKAGHIMLLPETFSLQDLIQEALQLFELRIKEKNIAVTIADKLPLLYADRKGIREVVVNLLENAIKFSGDNPNPHIIINGYEDAGYFIFSIKDSGIGIDPNYFNKIFGLFNKLDISSEGSGVGLSLVKQIIELHGGETWVTSEGEGKGSTFYFKIPLTK